MNELDTAPVDDLPEIVLGDSSDQGCMSCAHLSPASADPGGGLFWECRRYPPQVIALPDPETGMLEGTRTYPTVDETDWCGEWESDSPDELTDDHEG